VKSQSFIPRHLNQWTDLRVIPRDLIGTTCFILGFPPFSQEINRCTMIGDVFGLNHSAQKVRFQHEYKQIVSLSGGTEISSSNGLRASNLEESVRTWRAHCAGQRSTYARERPYAMVLVRLNGWLCVQPGLRHDGEAGIPRSDPKAAVRYYFARAIQPGHLDSSHGLCIHTRAVEGQRLVRNASILR